MKAMGLGGWHWLVRSMHRGTSCTENNEFENRPCIVRYREHDACTSRNAHSIRRIPAQKLATGKEVRVQRNALKVLEEAEAEGIPEVRQDRCIATLTYKYTLKKNIVTASRIVARCRWRLRETVLIEIVVLVCPQEDSFDDSDTEDEPPPRKRGNREKEKGEGPSGRSTKNAKEDKDERKRNTTKRARVVDPEPGIVSRRKSDRKKEQERLNSTGTRVNFAKLETAALRKYKSYYKLPDSGHDTKDQLVSSVTSHFRQYSVEEKKVIHLFLRTTMERGLSGG